MADIDLRYSIIADLLRSVYAEYYAPDQLLEYAERIVAFVKENN